MSIETKIETAVPNDEVTGTNLPRCVPYILTHTPAGFIPRPGDVVVRALETILYISRNGWCNGSVAHDGDRIRAQPMRQGESVTFAAK